MDLTQFKKLSTGRPPRIVVGIEQLTDRTARTLLYGYTVERHTWHVYLDAEGQIHRLMFDHDEQPLFHAVGRAGGCTDNYQYLPSKRLYPESCDYEFCLLLMQAGETLPFTTFHKEGSERRLAAHRPYAGKTFADLAAGVELL